VAHSACFADGIGGFGLPAPNATNIENFSRNQFAPLILAIVLTAAVMAAASSFYPQWCVDCGYYLAIAQGKLAEVIQPFSSRFLHPFIARALTRLGINTLGLAFALLAVGGLLVLIGFIAAMVRDRCQRLWILAPLLFSPALIDLYRFGFMPDLFHAALVAAFFWLMLRGWRIGMLAMIPLMYFTREATVLLSVITAVVLWRRKDRPTAIAETCLTAISMIISARVIAHGQPNIHHLNPLLYTAGKIPFNFLKNIVGLEAWTNTFDHPAAWKTSLPRWLQFGNIREVGIRRFRLAAPLGMLLYWLVSFGALPLLLLRSLQQRRRRAMSAGTPSSPTAIHIALIYGLVSFAISPLLGSTVARFVVYGWPAFWIATIWFFCEEYSPTIGQLCALIACHQALLWITWLPSAFNSEIGGLLTALGLAAFLYALTWWHTGLISRKE